MIWRNIIASKPFIPVVLDLGQSNDTGRAESTRLANTDFNYQGIATGYPTVRAGQAQYSGQNDNVRIYWKGRATGTLDVTWSPDNGVWQSMNAGVNTSMDTLTLSQFGIEVSLGEQLNQHFNQQIQIIKCAFGNTSLDGVHNPAANGNWSASGTCRSIALDYFIERGINDLKAEFPGTDIKIVGIIWHQGESDRDPLQFADYVTNFATFRSYIEAGLLAIDSTFTDPDWYLTKIHYSLTANEASLNAQIDLIPDVNLLEISTYPRKQDMTTAEAAPTALGTPNSNGGEDDIHSSYITQLSKGELASTIIKSKYV